MKRIFQEAPLIPFSKEEINGFFKTMGSDVKDLLDDYSIRIQNCDNIGETMYQYEGLKRKISDYFNSVKIQ